MTGMIFLNARVLEEGESLQSYFLWLAENNLHQTPWSVLTILPTDLRKVQSGITREPIRGYPLMCQALPGSRRLAPPPRGTPAVQHIDDMIEDLIASEEVMHIGNPDRQQDTVRWPE